MIELNRGFYHRRLSYYRGSYKSEIGFNFNSMKVLASVIGLSDKIEIVFDQ